METVQQALLLRGALVAQTYTSKTVTLTANGDVWFAFGANNDLALKFSLEQWNEIVEFVNVQILKEFEDKQDKEKCRKCG